MYVSSFPGFFPFSHIFLFGLEFRLAWRYQGLATFDILWEVSMCQSHNKLGSHNEHGDWWLKPQPDVWRWVAPKLDASTTSKHVLGDAGDDFKSIHKNGLLNIRDTTDSLARRTTCFGSLQIVGIRWHLWICDDMCGQFAEGMSPSTFYLQPCLNRSQPLRQGNQFPPRGPMESPGVRTYGYVFF